MKTIQKLLFILALTLTFSCAKKAEEKNSAELAYTKAAKFLKDKSYSEAADAFEKIDSDFPFSRPISFNQAVKAVSLLPFFMVC